MTELLAVNELITLHAYTKAASTYNVPRNQLKMHGNGNGVEP